MNQSYEPHQGTLFVITLFRVVGLASEECHEVWLKLHQNQNT